MTEKDLRTLYSILDLQTPLLEDCGHLCGAACCFDESEDGTLCGVDLLPIEASVLADVSWAQIIDDPVSSGPMLMCTSPCEREKRPWLCRIFPLCTVDSGRKIRIDARSRAVCPLSRSGLKSFSVDFKQGVLTSAAFLKEFDDGLAFIRRWEDLESQFRDPLW